MPLRNFIMPTKKQKTKTRLTTSNKNISELNVDLKDIKKRAMEPRLSMESLLKKLKADGLI